MNVAIGMLTMNAGDDIPGSTIKWAIKNYLTEFKRIIVADGNLTEDAERFYSQFPNVEVINSPWKDSYVAQYEAIVNHLKDGEWCFYIDDDEIPSDALKKTLLNKEAFSLITKNVDLVRIPCQLHLTEDGKSYFSSENHPIDTYEGQWTKNILFKKNDGLFFRHFGSHVIPHNKSGKYGYYPRPYYHMKNHESFVYNDVWQAFLSPEGQGYNPTEAAKFKMFISGFKNTKEFKKATKSDKWPPTLKKFAWDNRREYNRPISRLAWTYWILEGNPMPSKDEFMTWENVKQYVLSPESMEIYNLNKKNNNGIIIE